MIWKDEYSIGIEEVDSQHKTLLNHFRTIGEAFAEKKSWSDTHFEIVELRDFADFHFRFEDALMRLYACPQREQHNRIHEKFFEKIQSFEQSSLLMQNDREVVQFFSDWLVNHIQGDDRAYAQHIISGARVVRAR